MDHPGFEIVEASERGLLAVALGGVPEVSLSNPADVLVILDGDARVPAQVLPYPDGDGRTVRVELSEDVSIEPPVPVVFDLPDFMLEDGFIRMRALDDLAGCAAIAGRDGAAGSRECRVRRLRRLHPRRGGRSVRRTADGRGPELCPPETLVVSIESSPLIPGVEQGAGPVIRTGDALYTFDAEAEQVLIVARESIRQRNPDFKSQRQLMSGGVCEGTAFAVWGYRATGMAFPLGNYHNATTGIRDPESGIGAEYIRVEDFLGGVELLTEAAKCVGKRNDSPARERVREVPDDIRARMTGDH